MIRQFIPSGYCLKCQGCCRFRDENSRWAPCLLDDEALEMVDRTGIPAVSLSMDKRIMPVAEPQSGGFVCPLLDLANNKCRLYEKRPFECQLYPFLINMRHKKIILTLDLNCPYIKDKMDSPEFKEYCEYLSKQLNSQESLKLLKDNPQILQAYEEVLDLIELEAPHETENPAPG